MTERGRNAAQFDAGGFEIGDSQAVWDGDVLTLRIHETCAPLPRPMRGTIRVRPRAIAGQRFEIAEQGRHIWSPIAPTADIEIDFDAPDLRWSGRGYLDTNRGDEPLERRFQYWDWSRAESGPEETTILYNTHPRAAPGRALALRFDQNGEATALEPPQPAPLPATPIWRIRRTTRCDGGRDARIVRTLEDTPFYSRSVIESPLFGARQRAMHESFSGDRLSASVVKALLPFRMPRLARAGRP